MSCSHIAASRFIQRTNRRQPGRGRSLPLVLAAVATLVSCSREPAIDAPGSTASNQENAPSSGFSTPPESGPKPTPATTTATATPLAPEGESTAIQDEETLRMVARLERIANRVQPLENFYLNDINLAYLERQLADESISNLFEWRNRYPTELMRAGYSERSVAAFAEWIEYLERSDPEFFALNRSQLLSLHALAYIRLGEQDNCLEHHSSDSCLLPIAKDGIHRVRRGSEGAIPLLESVLGGNPDDLRARWLLNLAHMTLGTYPDAVPDRWRIPPDTFESEHPMNRFGDIAPALGVNVAELSGGSILEDFDGDGYLDLMVSSIGLRHQTRLFMNDRRAGFVDRTAAAGLTGIVGGLNLVQADYNNDGFIDVLVLRGAWFGRAGRHPNSLLRNNGNGTFTDVTESAGLLSYHPTQTAVWLDYNLDGWIDLYIGNESGRQYRNRTELFRNNGDGTFTECGAAAGVRLLALVKAVVSADYNNDGRPDLFVSCLDAPNVLFRNHGPAESAPDGKGAWKFSPDSDAGVSEPTQSFPAWFFDYDNDGWEDLFVAGYRLESIDDVVADMLGMASSAVTSRLFRNLGNGRFEDRSQPAGMDRVLLAMGCNYGDLDNDGWLDAYLGTGAPPFEFLIPNVALRNAEGERFQDVTTAAGLGHLQKGHGVSFGDVDMDGDQDIHIGIGGAFTGDIYHNAFFENPGNGNRWITLKLEGVRENRAAIGARIRVVVRVGDDTREIHRTVRSGGSFGGSPLRQEIGLGNAAAIEQVEIFWPTSGQTQRLTDLSLDRVYRIREDEPEAIEWTLPPFRLKSMNPTGAAHRHH